MKTKLSSFKQIIIILAAVFTIAVVQSPKVCAESFSISPMYQNASLIPGETFYGSFKITNPNSNDADFTYQISIEPFKVDESHEVVLENNGDYNRIVDWIQLENMSGTLQPNSVKEVHFSIITPENAPAGGQYAAIVVSSDGNSPKDGSVNIETNYRITHLIYADVAGETVRKGDISEVNVPGFLFSGNITGTAKIKNLGNVHSRATHTLQVFPLFSNEEVYTNEENPQTSFIMPSTTKVTNTTWENTPSLGIFHVIYHVEYEGVESKVDKIVIVCPLWLLFLILLAIFLIIFRILSVKKSTKKKETK